MSSATNRYYVDCRTPLRGMVMHARYCSKAKYVVGSNNGYVTYFLYEYFLTLGSTFLQSMRRKKTNSSTRPHLRYRRVASPSTRVRRTLTLHEGTPRVSSVAVFDAISLRIVVILSGAGIWKPEPRICCSCS